MFRSLKVATKYRAQEHLFRGVNGHSKLRSVHSDKANNACGVSHFACLTANNIWPLVPSSGSRGRHRNSVEF